MNTRTAITALGHIIVASLLLCGCVLALKHSNAPFGWMAMAAFVLCLQACLLIRQPGLRSAALMLGFFLLPLGLAEFYLGWQAPTGSATEFTPEGAMLRTVDHLGYAPQPDTRVHAVRSNQEALIYDAHYTINDHALRATPTSNYNPSAPCLLFFGGSFTFGEGVQDTETLPNQVAALLDSKYRVVNFGFPGYGPHQMLGALESGFVDKVAGDCSDVTAIYTGIAQHVGRVNGKAVWDVHGPDYQLNSAGKVQFQGHFDETGIPYLSKLEPYLYKSKIYSLLFGWQLTGPFNAQQIDLYAGIISRSRALVKQQFGADTRFFTLMWDAGFFAEDPENFQAILKALAARELAPKVVDQEVLPTTTEFSEYKLSPLDSHPNALGYQRVADFIIRTWL